MQRSTYVHVFAQDVFGPNQFLTVLWWGFGRGVAMVWPFISMFVSSGAQRKMGQKRRGIGRIETISPAVNGGSNGGLTINASAWASVAIIELS